VGITNWGIVNIEKGFNPIYYKDAVAFGKTLGIDPDVLLNEYTRFCKPGYGKRIKTIRNLYGVSQYDFAEMLGAERRTVSVWEAVSNWERNICVPEFKYVKIIERVALKKGITLAQLNECPELFEDDYEAFCKPGYGALLSDIRNSMSVSRAEFARMIGIKPSTYCLWEREQFIPNRDNYNVLKKALAEKGVSLDESYRTKNMAD
jgi:DNA-binding transcriptional regulator YiaG